MTASCAPLGAGRLSVTIEHEVGDTSRVANLVRIYQRADAAHEAWKVLDLIVQKPSDPI